jgi:hypothetical protein
MRANPRRPSYAAVTATLALVVALGGGAYAATSLPKHSVGSKQLRSNAVRRSKIKGNAVNGAKVAKDSLTGSDIKESALGKVPSAGGADSATNATNATHAASSAGVDKITYVTTPPMPIGGGPFGSGTATAACPAGQHVTGGGAHVSNESGDNVNDSFPAAGGAGWTATVFGGASDTFTVTAVCVSAGSVG